MLRSHEHVDGPASHETDHRTTPAQPNAAPAPPAVLAVDGLGKHYDRGQETVAVLQDLSFTLAQGQFVSLVGPSGVGKSTLLRCLAGLTPPSSGRVLLHDQVVTGPPPEIALLFQDFSRSLMPWLRNGANVALPLRSNGVGKADRAQRVRDALEAVGLPEVENMFPWQLSGGMQQRVAIARAIAYRPEVMLMDEPFASVDAQTRFDLEDLLLDIHRRFGMSTVFVTHDIDEAVYLSDEVVVLNGKPAGVAARLTIPFGLDRDQITTRAEPDFATYRSAILREVRGMRGRS
jgi:NitT/TauT family transport system ATP-binding protein